MLLKCCDRVAAAEKMSFFRSSFRKLGIRLAKIKNRAGTAGKMGLLIFLTCVSPRWTREGCFGPKNAKKNPLKNPF